MTQDPDMSVQPWMKDEGSVESPETPRPLVDTVVTGKRVTGEDGFL